MLDRGVNADRGGAGKQDRGFKPTTGSWSYNSIPTEDRRRSFRREGKPERLINHLHILRFYLRPFAPTQWDW